MTEDLPNDHDLKTDCPLPPETRVRVQFAGLSYKASSRLAVSNIGRADEFCWNTDTYPTMNLVVGHYEVIPPLASGLLRAEDIVTVGVAEWSTTYRCQYCGSRFVVSDDSQNALSPHLEHYCPLAAS
jgi:hypothetical protein